MLFNSIDFAIFLPVVFMLYWFVAKKSIRLQNLLIVAASYFFYASWDYRFLSLILLSTLVDFLVGLKLSKEENQRKRKLLLWTSIGLNLGLLGFFKYFNFFLDNFISTFSFYGAELNASSLNIILPVGISFYTFQTLSYTIDVYKKKLKPTDDIIAFASFVSFFPQLVAGPIEKASNLLPQFYKQRRFDYHLAVDGLRQILWGLFKKMVIADNCAEYANLIFNNPGDYNGATLLLGAIFFAFQIYGDFSGYSDIAIGTAKLFGINLKQNFSFPYFSRDIAEFWRRWHISLTTWFKDYLYIPLGGSRGSVLMIIRNTFIVFLVSGFWHGDKWTFIVWGALNAVYFLPLLLSKKNRVHLNVVAEGRIFPSFMELVKMLFTFGLCTVAWVFFRAESIQHAIDYLSQMFSKSILSVPNMVGRNTDILILFVLMIFFILMEWNGRERKFAIEKNNNGTKRFISWGFYLLIISLIFIYEGEAQQFIYFQF